MHFQFCYYTKKNHKSRNVQIVLIELEVGLGLRSTRRKVRPGLNWSFKDLLQILPVMIV